MRRESVVIAWLRDSQSSAELSTIELASFSILSQEHIARGKTRLFIRHEQAKAKRLLEYLHGDCRICSTARADNPRKSFQQQYSHSLAP
jgi:hypothetical protein